MQRTAYAPELLLARKHEPTERAGPGFGNGLLAGLLSGQPLQGLGQAVGLENLQRILGLPQAAQLFSSNQRAQAAMARSRGGAPVGSMLELWEAVEGPMPPAVRERLLGGLGVCEEDALWGSCEASPELEEPLPSVDPGLMSRMTSAESGYDGVLSAREPQMPQLVYSVEGEAQVLHGYGNPLRVESDGQVRDEDLYRFRPGWSGDKAWMPLSKIRGNVETPFTIWHVGLEDHLFVGEGPRPDDIEQGREGSCWLLAALTVIAAQDPDALAGMMSLDCGVFSVRLHYLDGDAWRPVTIRTSADAPVDGSWRPLTALPRSVEEGEYSDFEVNAASDCLAVIERRYHRLGLWVPLMEKAFAIFAERYGPDGRGVGATGCEGASGWDLIYGGFVQDAMQVLFGEAAEDVGWNAAGHGEQGAPDLSDPGTIAYLRCLAQLAGRTPGSELLVYSISGREEDPALRLDAALRSVVEQPWIELKLETALRALNVDVQALLTDPGDAALRAKVGAAAAVLADPAFGTALHDPNPKGRIPLLLESLRVWSGMPWGPRLAWPHAYAILEVRLVDAGGQPVGPGDDAALSAVDLHASTVLLRNPWGRVEPQLVPETFPADDGRFRLTVHQALRWLPTIKGATVRSDGD